MTVEKRPGTGNRYVTRTKRVGGKLKRRYIGPLSSPEVSLLSRVAAIDKAIRRSELVDLRGDVEASRVLERSLERQHRTVMLVKALSKHCDKRNVKPRPSSDADPSHHLAGQHGIPTFRMLQRVSGLAAAGDQIASLQLDCWCRDFPETLKAATDLTGLVRQQVIEFLAGDSPTTAELIKRRLDHATTSLTAELLPDPLAQMMAEAVTVAWYDFMRCQLASQRIIGDAKSAKYWDRACDRAQRRWLSISAAFEQFRESQLRKTRRRKPTKRKAKTPQPPHGQ